MNDCWVCLGEWCCWASRSTIASERENRIRTANELEFVVVWEIRLMEPLLLRRRCHRRCRRSNGVDFARSATAVVAAAATAADAAADEDVCLCSPRVKAVAWVVVRFRADDDGDDDVDVWIDEYAAVAAE